MANDAFSQQALAQDAHFRARVRSALATVAWQIVNESTDTANHANRLAYARQVIRNLNGEVANIVDSLVMRTNVLAFATSYTFDFVTQQGHVVSASGDPDIQSQISTDWNALAAAAGYSTVSTP